jgi:hypothetical protein
MLLGIGVFVFYFLRRMITIFGNQRGGETFFSNPVLAIIMITAALSGVATFLIGACSFFKKERSILVVISTLFGLFVTFFWLGEFISPH